MKLALNQFLIEELIKCTYFFPKEEDRKKNRAKNDSPLTSIILSIFLNVPNTLHQRVYSFFQKRVDQTERKSLAPLLIQISVRKIPDIGKILT